MAKFPINTTMAQTMCSDFLETDEFIVYQFELSNYCSRDIYINEIEFFHIKRGSNITFTFIF